MKGRITAVSTASWISNITRFVGSNGSTREAVVAQPARSAEKSPMAAARTTLRRAIIGRSLSAARRGLVRSRRGGLVEQKLPDHLLENDCRLRLCDLAAVGKHRRIAARVETDVDFAEEP